MLPMPFYINEELFYEDITLSQEEFYEKLGEDANISTSQPTPADVMELWEKLLLEAEEVVHIPMSSGLSNSCETAMVLAREYHGRVHVVDNQRILCYSETVCSGRHCVGKSGQDWCRN